MREKTNERNREKQKRWRFEKMPADRPDEIMFLFIAHGWHGRDIPLGENVHSRLFRLLEFDDDFLWLDRSVHFLDPEIRFDDDARNVALVQHRISEADVVLLASDVPHSERPWLKHEMGIARDLKKPILAIKPYGRRYWSRRFAEVADGLAVYRRQSIIDGIRALRGLTKERRQELLDRGRPCWKCGSTRVCLDLNRLGGTYCSECGVSTYRVPGFGRRRMSQITDPYGDGPLLVGSTR